MSLPAFFSLVSSILFIISMSWYVYDVAKGKVTVSIATFIALSIVTVSQLASLIAEQSWYLVPFSLIAVLVNISICVLAFRSKKIYFRTLDKIALAGVLLGVVVWLITSDALLNIYILTLVMIVSATPLVVKTFKYPQTETRLPWMLNFVASVLLLFTITSSSPANWLVPARQLLLSLSVNLALVWPQRNKK